MKEDEVKKEKEKKSGNPIFILIIFIVLLGFIFVVPELYQKFHSSLAETLGIGSKNQQDTPTNNEEDDIISVSEYYQINSNDTLTYNEITISNVELTNDILSFDISSENAVDLTSLHYYIEFYQEKYTFLGRRILEGEVNTKGHVAIDVTNLNVTPMTYFNIAHIEDSSIPKFNLETDESGIGNVTCTKGNESYSYDFSLNELITVIYKYTYQNNDMSTYTDKLLAYQKLAKEYNDLNGVTAVVADNSGTFIYTLELDYSSIDTFSRVNDIHKFSKGELPYIVKFKMDAKGYNCV